MAATITPPTNPHPASPSRERRRSERRPHTVEAFLSSPTGGDRLEVASIDLSRHGVGLRLMKPIASGTFKALELGLGSQHLITEVRILSCRQEKDGSFRVHAAFC